MYLEPFHHCCGVGELGEISEAENPQEVILYVKRMKPRQFAQIVFVQAQSREAEKPEKEEYPPKPLLKDFPASQGYTREDYDDAIIQWNETKEDYDTDFELAMDDWQSDSRPYGQELADYIEAKGLGSVVASDEQVNPSSGNTLTTFVWTPNWKKLRK